MNMVQIYQPGVYVCKFVVLWNLGEKDFEKFQVYLKIHLSNLHTNPPILT